MNHFILRIRDANLLRRSCAKLLIQHNISEDELVKFTTNNKLQTIHLNNGTILSAITDDRFPTFDHPFIPPSHQWTAICYLLRYKYPHFDIYSRINTGAIPRKIFPSIIHRQHLNTVFELPAEDRAIIGDAFQLNQGDQVIELGPFMGFGTVKMSSLVGETGRIVSIEADPDAHSIQAQNIEQNSLKNITALNYAISDSDSDSVPFYKTELQANSLLKGLLKTDNAINVNTITIDTILERENFTPNFLVMTVNGVELEVLQASKNFLCNAKDLRIIVPGWYKDNECKIGSRIIEFLSACGFKVFSTKGLHIFAYK